MLITVANAIMDITYQEAFVCIVDLIVVHVLISWVASIVQDLICIYRIKHVLYALCIVLAVSTPHHAQNVLITTIYPIILAFLVVEGARPVLTI